MAKTGSTVRGLWILIPLLLLIPASAASAADETATASISMEPQSGTLYKEALRPVNWRVEVEVKAPFTSPNLQPTKHIKAFFPEEMKFVPGAATGICPESAVGPPPVNLSVPPEEVIARCPDSLIGNGSAVLRLAQANCSGCTYLEDPVLLVFYGGDDGEGRTILRIYAYSEAVATGLYMEGVFRDSVLEVEVPPVTGDSSTSIFDLNIPGSNDPVPGRRGVDPHFVQTTCRAGTWSGFAELTLGSRDTLGLPTSPDLLLKTPDFSTGCFGAEGKARLARLKLKGPGSVKRGKTGSYKVSVRNNGTATARGGKLMVRGRGVSGKSVIGSLAPGASRTVRVKVAFRRSGKINARFQAKFKGTGIQASVKRIKVT